MEPRRQAFIKAMDALVAMWTARRAESNVGEDGGLPWEKMRKLSKLDDLRTMEGELLRPGGWYVTNTDMRRAIRELISGPHQTKAEAVDWNSEMLK